MLKKKKVQWNRIIAFFLAFLMVITSFKVESFVVHAEESSDIVLEELYHEISLNEGQLLPDGSVTENEIYAYVEGYELKKGHSLSISDSNYVFSVRKFANENYETMLKSATNASFTATEDMTIGMLIRKPDKSALTKEEIESLVIEDSVYGMTEVDGYAHRFTVEAETIDGGTATTRAAVFLPGSYSENGVATKLIVMTNGYSAYLTDSVWNGNADHNTQLIKNYLKNGYAVWVVDNTAARTSQTPDLGCPQLVDSYLKAYEYIQNHFNVEKQFSIHSRSFGTFAAMRIMQEVPELVKCGIMTGPRVSIEHEYRGLDKAFIANRFGFEDIAGATYEADKMVGYDPYTDVDREKYELPPTFWMMAEGDATTEPTEVIGKLIAHGNNVQTETFAGVSHTDVCTLNSEEMMTSALEFLENYQSISLNNKTISILGDSISTYVNASNGTAASTTNSTIKNGAVYYSGSNLGVSLNDTWWKQAADELGMEILVNNSWSGSCILKPRQGAGTEGYSDRSINLHDNTGDNAGEEPDIIAVYLGTNDFSYYQDTLGKASEVDYDSLITETADGYTFVTPTTSAEAYAIMLHRITECYPDAEVYCFTLLPRENASDSQVSLLEEFNQTIESIAEHYGAYVVDLYGDSGILDESYAFDPYIDDNRVHPGVKGMDAIANTFISSILSNSKYAVDENIYNVSYDLNNVIVDQGNTYAIRGERPFNITLSASTGAELTVSVQMDGKDVTNQVYQEGNVFIENVVGDIKITAIAEIPLKEAKNYRFEMVDGTLVSVMDSVNTENKLSSTTTGIYNLSEDVVLYHDRNWAVEWKASGSETFMALASTTNPATNGAQYLYKSGSGLGLIAFGFRENGQYHNYGIALKSIGIDWTQEHIYRMINQVNEDGSNSIYLYVDGENLGTMTDYYLAGTSLQNQNNKYLSGKDFVYSHIGASSFELDAGQMSYLQVWEDISTQPYHGKVISVLGDSISTFAGYIPVADGFNLEHLARYPQDNLVTDVNETWWMQIVNELGAKLGINDSWRGSTVCGSASVTSGAAGSDAAMSNLVRIQNLGSNGTPDVILFYGGTNDLAHISLVGTFDTATAPTEVDLTTTAWNNLADGYVNTLLRLKHFYPKAEIIAMLPTYTASYYSDTKLSQANEVLAQICEHYGVKYIDLRDSGVTKDYLPDGIHPGAEGMDMITNTVLNKLVTECEMEAGENVVHSVQHELTNVKASLGYYKGISDGMAFVETLTADNEMIVRVLMGGTDITEQCYSKGVISVEEVTGDLSITAEAVFSLGDRLQTLPDNYYGANLWPLLRHDDDYYSTNGWAVHSSGNVKSVTIPVVVDERIYASSFADSGTNGGSVSGIRVTFFDNKGVLVSMDAASVYEEFCQNGYITVPQNAVAVSIPMWTAADTWELYISDSSSIPGFSLGEHLQELPEHFCQNTNLWEVLEPEDVYFYKTKWDKLSSGEVYSVTVPVVAGEKLWATSFQEKGTNGGTRDGIRLTYFSDKGVLNSIDPDVVYNEFAENGYLTVPEGTTAVNVVMWKNDADTEFYILSKEHSFTNYVSDNNASTEADGTKTAKCDYCDETDTIVDEGSSVPWKALKGKVISILGASTCTFEGYIPVGDGFNLAHRARYPQDNLLTDVNETWWMQVINQLNAKLGINDSWAGSRVLNTIDGNSGDLGEKASLASLTRIQNLGSNGTPDVIFFFGGMNDIGNLSPLGEFDANTAPTKVDLSSTKWDTFAEAYTDAIMRIQYYYPEAQIIVILPSSTASYYTDAELQQYCSVMKAICEHYDVDYVNLQESELSLIHMPDGIHPNEEGMDIITDVVVSELVKTCKFEEGENEVYSVIHYLTNVDATLGYYKGISSGNEFEEILTANSAMSVIVNMGGKDITSSCYQNGKISIEKVTGDVVITAKAKYDFDGHLQQLPGDICSGVNIWEVLEPENIYYTANGWGTTGNGNQYSVTFPVKNEDKIWATSFGTTATNGFAANGTRITWFSEEGILQSLTRDKVYNEYAQYGYITVPEGAVALNIPMASASEDWEIYILNREHSFTNYVSDSNATCTEDGTKTAQCDICTATNTVVDTGSATGHTYGLWSTSVEVTCTNDGEERRDCINCDHYETRVVKSNGHNYSEKTFSPTCTEKGYILHTCSVCNDTYKDAYVDELGHSFNQYTSDGNATCTTDGTKTAKCDGCAVTDTVADKGSATGHSLGEWKVITVATCTTDGTEKRECSNCDYFETQTLKAIGHKYGSWFTSVDVTCTSDGEERRDCNNCDHYETRVVKSSGHNYSEKTFSPTCTEKGYILHTCSVCNDNYKDAYVNALGHSFTQYVSDNNATCTTDGTKTAKCDRCTATDTVTDAESAIGHSLGYWEVVTPSTCTTEGFKARSCSNCDYSESKVIVAKGHNYVARITTATCTEKGFVTYICSRCNDSYIGNTVDPTGHSLREWHVLTEATCTTEGLKKRTCRNCDYFENMIIPATGHSYVMENVQPTCTEQGYNHYICEVCEDNYKDYFGEALRHEFTDWKEVISPTCTVEGEAHRECSRCAHTEVAALPVIAHEFTLYVSDNNATPEADGTMTAQCNNCTATDTMVQLGSKLEVIRLEITDKPSKLDYVKGEALELSDMIVVAYFDNGKSVELQDYKVSGYSDQVIGKQTVIISHKGKYDTFEVTVNKKPIENLSSSIYTVENHLIRKVVAGTRANAFLSSMDDRDYLQLLKNNKEVLNKELIATGMFLKLYDGNQVKDYATVIVEGDVNGDGRITITDMLMIKAHILGRQALQVPMRYAGDLNSDGNITITDYIMIRKYILMSVFY